MHFPVALVLGLLVGGCAYVTAEQPVGEAPLALNPEQWEGTWYADGEPLEIRVVDASRGHLRLHANDEDLPDSFDLWLRASAGWQFFNVRVADLESEDDADPQEAVGDAGTAALAESDGKTTTDQAETGDDRGPEAEHWFWGRVKATDEVLLLWYPDPTAFAARVQDGTFPGTVMEGEYLHGVRLGALTPAQLATIMDGSRGMLLDWDDPLVLSRPVNPVSERIDSDDE